MRAFRMMAIGAAKAAPIGGTVPPPSRVLSGPLIAATASAQTRRPIGIDDLLAFHRVSEPQISPDGAAVVYTVATPDRAGKPRRHATSGSCRPPAATPRQLTSTGGRRRALVAGRQAPRLSVEPRRRRQQIYLLNLTGGEPPKLTTLAGGADNIVWSPDGKSLAFTSPV